MNAFFTDNFHISDIVYCGVVPMNNWECLRPKRRLHGLIYQVSGKKSYDFDYPVCKQHIDITQGDLYYLPKGSEYLVTDIGYGDCIAIDFELADPNAVYPYFVFTPQNAQKYAQKFEQVVHHWEQKRSGYLNRCMALLYQILSDLQADASPHYQVSKNVQLSQKGAQIMQSRIADPTLSVATVAKELSISQEYFRRLFFDVYRQSPRKYLVQLRCEKAKELLLSGEYKIAKIAQLCGFETPSYFCRVFSQQYGMSPSQYLQR